MTTGDSTCISLPRCPIHHIHQNDYLFSPSINKQSTRHTETQLLCKHGDTAGSSVYHYQDAQSIIYTRGRFNDEVMKGFYFFNTVQGSVLLPHYRTLYTRGGVTLLQLIRQVLPRAVHKHGNHVSHRSLVATLPVT